MISTESILGSVLIYNFFTEIFYNLKIGCKLKVYNTKNNFFKWTIRLSILFLYYEKLFRLCN